MISSNNTPTLREFADFFKGCVEAMPNVKGLAIFNDCKENHKFLKKPVEAMTKVSTSSERQTTQEIHNVNSHAVAQEASATTSIAPAYFNCERT